MADNKVIANGGSGSNFTAATDEIAGVDYQKIKLYDPTLDSTDPVGVIDHGATVSLYVHPRPDTVIPSTPVSSGSLTTSTTAYSDGDTLGAGWTVPNAAKASAGTGRIIGVSLSDYSDVTTTVRLYFAQGSITFGTDNAAPSISDADSLKLLPGVINLTMGDLGGVRFGAEHSISIPYVLDGTDLFVYAVTVAGHTFFGAATDLRLRVHLTRD